MSRLTMFLCCALGPLSACLDVAEDRAQLDLDVGRARAGEVSIDVTDGLAAVRMLGPDSTWLWAKAPVLELTLAFDGPRPQTFVLTVENALSDAALTGVAGSEAVAVTLVEGAVPTEKRWSIVLPPGTAPVRLRMAPPDAEDRTPFRFAFYADVQEAIVQVQDIYSRMNTDPTIRFALIGGDLTRRGHRYEMERFAREMKTLRFPCYATIGNHELGQSPELFHEFFGRGSSHFVFRGVHYTLLDSASATVAPTVYRWLDGWLDDARDALHVVTMHIPPLDPTGTRNGAFASRPEANKVLARLADGRVDLTLYGHIHSYYAFSNAGIPAFIAGGGGAIPEELDGIKRHYLTIDVDPKSGRLQTSIVRVD